MFIVQTSGKNSNFKVRIHWSLKILILTDNSDNVYLFMSRSYLCQIYSYISHEYYQIQPPHQKVYVNCLVEPPKSWLHHEAGTLDYFHDLWSALSFTLWTKVFQSQKAENKISRDNRTQFCQELCQDLQCGSKSVFLYLHVCITTSDIFSFKISKG